MKELVDNAFALCIGSIFFVWVLLLLPFVLGYQEPQPPGKDEQS